MELDLAQVRALAAVVREGSFDAAARRLHLTPSAVSQRVKALETRVGQVLVRRSRPCVATEAGRALVRLAGQWDALEADALRLVGGTGTDAAATTLSIAVNADSLSTWFPAVAATLPEDLLLDVHREDQDHSAALLRAGDVMAAVTADSAPVQGCQVLPLGAMRYRAVASGPFLGRWFTDGLTAEALGRAPVLVFNRKDALQHRFVRRVTGRTLDPPVHRVPSSAAFVALVREGLAWGMVPEASMGRELAAGELVELDPGSPLDVPLYWQHWRLGSTSLGTLTATVVAEAGRALVRAPSV